MLSFWDHDHRLRRRDFLKVGGFGLAGLASSSLAGIEEKAALTGKSVIFLFLHGGPSQVETFDPKPESPKEFRGPLGTVQTKLPGVLFGSPFPKLANHADKLTIVRSYVPGDANHDIKPVVCRATGGANIGSLYAAVAGISHPEKAIPRNALLFPRAVDPEAQAGTSTFGRFDATGPFSASLSPVQPGAGNGMMENLKIKLPREQLDDRLGLLKTLDNVRWAIDDHLRAETSDKSRELALLALMGGLADALDLSKEDPKTISRYDTAPLFDVSKIDKKWKNHKNYTDNAKTMGKLLCLARRMCERGAGFVTVTTNFVWDMHADVNNATIEEGMGYMAPSLDHAVSAFLEDVQSRGLSDKILLVVCGEMGRTPKINGKGGRDHWGNLGPLILAGGGYPMGQVIGKSRYDASSPSSEPVTQGMVISTVLQTLMDYPKLRLQPDIAREVITAGSHANIFG